MFIGIGINTDDYRQVLGVELAGRESQTGWRDFLASLRDRGLHRVELVISDAHEGLRKSLMEMLPEAVWQRCYVHFLRNALDHLPLLARSVIVTEVCRPSCIRLDYLGHKEAGATGALATRRFELQCDVADTEVTGQHLLDGDE